MKSSFKIIIVTILVYSQVSTIFASNLSKSGFLEEQETAGITKVISFPISELKLIHENKELYGIYPRRHFIDIFYKDQILARKGNDTYNSDYLENIIKRFDQLKSVPDSRVIFILNGYSPKASNLYRKKVPKAEDHEELIK